MLVGLLDKASHLEPCPALLHDFGDFFISLHRVLYHTFVCLFLFNLILIDLIAVFFLLLDYFALLGFDHPCQRIDGIIVLLLNRVRHPVGDRVDQALGLIFHDFVFLIRFVLVQDIRFIIVFARFRIIFILLLLWLFQVDHPPQHVLHRPQRLSAPELGSDARAGVRFWVGRIAMLISSHHFQLIFIVGYQSVT